MKNTWTHEDQMMLESDIKDSFLAGGAYFNLEPEYEDFEEVDFNEFCYTFYEGF